MGSRVRRYAVSWYFESWGDGVEMGAEELKVMLKNHGHDQRLTKEGGFTDYDMSGDRSMAHDDHIDWETIE